MYALRNKVQLIGHVGSKPQSHNYDEGKKMVRFSVATNETYRNAQGVKVTDTQWHNLVAFGKVAEIAEKFLDKGTEVALEGKLVNRSYIDKEGVKRYITEIHVSELLLLGSNAAKAAAEA
jgi:single-strand DNA-binding protein